MNTVAARLVELEEIVGVDFGASNDDESPAQVLERLVLEVESSKDVQRMHALEAFCRDYLQEFVRCSF
jgi:hypothetical protein